MRRKIHVQVDRRHSRGQANRNQRQPNPQHRRCTAQHKSFDHHLLHHAPPARAQRPAHRNLALPRHAPRQQQIRHVHACDEPQHACRCQQGQQPLLYVRVDQRIPIPFHPCHAVSLALLGVRVRRRHPLLDRCHLRCRSLHRHPAPQPRNHLVVGSIVPTPLVLRIQLHRNPYLPTHRGGSRRIPETRRHHTHYGVRHIVHPHHPADDPLIAAERFPPHRIAQHKGARVFPSCKTRRLRDKSAPQRRRRTQHCKQIRTYRLPIHLHRRALSLEIRAASQSRGERHVIERPALRLPLLKIGPRRIEEFLVVPTLLQQHQPPRILIRQRPQQHMIHHREHRRRRPNPQGQRPNHRCRKPRRTPHLPQRVTKILPQSLQPNPSPRLPSHILGQRQIAHFALCSNARVTLGLALRHAIRRRHPHMRLDLRIQLRLPRLAPKTPTPKTHRASSLLCALPTPPESNRSPPPSSPTSNDRAPGAGVLQP